MVWTKSAGVCAFAGCRQSLVVERTSKDPAALIGEIAHIVAHSGEGPRAEFAPPGGQIDGEANLLLMCPTDHKTIDRQPQTWTVERLVGMKEDHERWVRESLSLQEAGGDAGPLIQETVHSSLLRVASMPRFVYFAPCLVNERDVRSQLVVSDDSEIALPYIVRGNVLYTFNDLTEETTPFQKVIEGAAERDQAANWWGDPDLSKWYVTLLNRSLNKITGRRGLNLDKEHHRYYFDPDLDDAGIPRSRSVTYQPLNQAASTKNVVWRPKRKKTGEPKNHWTHLAVSLRFHRVTTHDWVLSVRPERRFTVDGIKPLVPKAIGRRATSAKSHMYNYQLLGELQFWKEYLSSGNPAMILDYGGQSLVIDAELTIGSAEWPGVPGDVRPFENTSREMDLFSSAGYYRAVDLNTNPDAELGIVELDDLVAMEAITRGDSDVLSEED
jgi:hypothetical protein